MSYMESDKDINIFIARETSSIYLSILPGNNRFISNLEDQHVAVRLGLVLKAPY